MKTYKEFRLGLEEGSFINRETHKRSQEFIAKKKEQEEKRRAGSALSNKNITMDPKKKSPQTPSITDSAVTEEKEANAENCSNLPSDEKKKERRMDIEKINKKIKPHHKKITAKKK